MWLINSQIQLRIIQSVKKALMEEAEKSLLQGLREIISIKSLPASNREHKLKAEEIFRTTIRCRGINSAK